MSKHTYALTPIGFIRSSLTRLEEAPRQGEEDAPEAWLDLDASLAPGLLGISAGDSLIILTWLHFAERDVLQVHPRGDPARPLSGVFATRSPDRPNPIGLHEVTVLEVTGRSLRIAPMEAIDGTPVIDIKPTVSSKFKV